MLLSPAALKPGPGLKCLPQQSHRDGRKGSQAGPTSRCGGRMRSTIFLLHLPPPGPVGTSQRMLHSSTWRPVAGHPLLSQLGKLVKGLASPAPNSSNPRAPPLRRNGTDGNHSVEQPLCVISSSPLGASAPQRRPLACTSVQSIYRTNQRLLGKTQMT